MSTLDVWLLGIGFFGAPLALAFGIGLMVVVWSR